MTQTTSEELIKHPKFQKFQEEFGYIPESDKNDLHKIRSRMLQGIYRSQKNEYSYCNYVDSNDCYINFMKNEKLNDAAMEEYDEIKSRGRLTDKKRLCQNLLSSQPLAFNIFIPLKWDNYKLATEVFKELYPFLKIRKITNIKLEYVPGDEKGETERLISTDKSCFDIFIEFETVENKKSCIGIEAKYTEPFSNTDFNKDTGYKKQRYIDAISKFNQQFDSQYTVKYLSPTYNQLFRNQLIVEEVKRETDYQNCIQIVLFSSVDTKCVDAIKGFKEMIKLDNSFLDLTIEILLKKLIGSDTDKSRRELFNQVYERYCNYDKLQPYLD
ncbi:MAG: hypothetical protein A3K10_16700 [Bacteroidetes bacterium RIFCSPLOWO2_12_FULL_31_6]|nr:MAG: hypothetical protein A3K10_16700 [Bacteroidetes bacterium RIFCSPLOWO2_12_FULL_31_6]